MGTQEELDLLIVEELDFQPPCDDEAAESHAAEWTLVCRGCGKPILICTEHLEELRAKYDDPKLAARHVPCGAAARTLDELVIVRPL